MPPHTVTVVAVDDHPLVLSGITHELKNEQTVRLIATGSRGQDVTRLVAHHKPDVLLLDVEMPEGEDGVQRFDAIGIIKDITQTYPKTKIIVISHESSKYLVNAVVSAGALGFIDKLDFRCTSSLPTAILTVHQNGMYLSSELYKLLQNRGGVGEVILSEQQHRALALRGTQPDATIEGLALMMGISAATYKKHLKAAADKLNARTTRSAVLKALQIGIIPIRPITAVTNTKRVTKKLPLCLRKND